MTGNWKLAVVCLGTLVYGQNDRPRPIAVSGKSHIEGVGSKPSNTTLKPRDFTSLTQIGTVATASPAESFAVSGNLAYVCDDNEIFVIDVSNPQNLQVVGTATSSLIQNSTASHCAFENNALIVFADQGGTTQSGPGPNVSTFSLANPTQPQLIHATAVSKRFWESPVVVGSFAFVPTQALTYVANTWAGQLGDLIAFNMTNLSNPQVAGTLANPQVDAQYGGQGVVEGAVQADTAVMYVAGSSSTGSQNNGLGRLQVVDFSNPAAMRVLAQLSVPGTIILNPPLIQGAVGVAIGNNGGFVGSINANPGEKGNIVVTTFDLTDRSTPVTIASVTTSFTPGLGQGATQIGNYLFAFAGARDANNNEVLLIVDASNPSAPAIQSIPVTRPFTSMQAVGTTLFATSGAGGFQAFSIPGLSSGGGSVCPVSMDVMLVLDRGSQVTSAAFEDAKTALSTFVDSLHLSVDQVGLVSFDSSAVVAQTLTTSEGTVDAAIAATALSANSYIGSGIAAAQQELAGPRHRPGASPLIVILSDGADAGAPSSGATAAAANAAKAAGIRIISVQFGSSATTVMSSIASSAGDFYLVSQ